MPFNYKSPGVYVEEVDKGARPIESVGTSVLALVGLVADSVRVEKPTGAIQQDTPTAPTLITNWTEFTNTYGDFDQAIPGSYLHHSVFGYFLNGGSGLFVVGLPVKGGAKGGAPQLPSGEAYLTNAAGQRLLRVAGPMKEGEQVSVEAQAPAQGAPEGTFNLVITRGTGEPKTISGVTVGKPARGQRSVATAVAQETDNQITVEVVEGASGVPAVGSRVALVPAAAAKPAVGDALKQMGVTKAFVGNAATRTGISALEAVDEVTLVACPDIVAAFEMGAATEDDVKAVQTALLNHCEMMKDRFAILDAPNKLNVQEMIDWRKNKMNFDSPKGYGALYYPWIKVAGATVPPSGFVAGVYARVDGERGVHKAPANEVVRGAIGLENNISRNEQDFLNPIGVNCIRSFPGRGIRIWGARTLASDPQWRYINVRRLFANVEESVLQGTQWIVFEPNDQVLWRQIRRDVSAFLNVVWRSGALFGTTAEQAFFVKCDEETNPTELRDLGYCIVEVGMAPVKPAEFVVFRVSQKSDGAGATSE